MEPNPYQSPTTPAAFNEIRIDAGQATSLAAAAYGVFVRGLGLSSIALGVWHSASASVYFLSGIPEATDGDKAFAICNGVALVATGLIILGCASAIVRFSYPTPILPEESSGSQPPSPAG